MKRLVVLVLCTYVGWVSARGSPYAELVEEYLSSPEAVGRYSSNITEDALLDVVSIIIYLHYCVYFLKKMKL